MRLLQSIQYLRVLAALSVVVYHVSARVGAPVGVLAAGVDVFFVISGVIMWMVTAGRPVSPGAFVFQRLVRIVPAYWFITLFMVAINILLPGVFPNLHTPPDHVVLSLLFVPHASPDGGLYPVLVPGWTLTYEMFFYALFAVALLLPTRVRGAAIVGAIGVLVLAGLLLVPRGAALFTYTNPQMLEFAAGVGLGVATTRGWLPSRRWGAALMLGGMGVFAALPFAPPLGAGLALLSWAVPSVCLVGGALCWEARGTVPEWRPMLSVAAASYAIYLSHGLVVSACWKLLGRYSDVGFAVVAVAGSVLVGLAFHAVIERPLTAALRRLPGRMPGLPSVRSATP